MLTRRRRKARASTGLVPPLGPALRASPRPRHLRRRAPSRRSSLHFSCAPRLPRRSLPPARPWRTCRCHALLPLASAAESSHALPPSPVPNHRACHSRPKESTGDAPDFVQRPRAPRLLSWWQCRMTSCARSRTLRHGGRAAAVPCCPRAIGQILLCPAALAGPAPSRSPLEICNREVQRWGMRSWVDLPWKRRGWGVVEVRGLLSKKRACCSSASTAGTSAARAECSWWKPMVGERRLR